MIRIIDQIRGLERKPQTPISQVIQLLEEAGNSISEFTAPENHRYFLLLVANILGHVWEHWGSAFSDLQIQHLLYRLLLPLPMESLKAILSFVKAAETSTVLERWAVLEPLLLRLIETAQLSSTGAAASEETSSLLALMEFLPASEQFQQKFLEPFVRQAAAAGLANFISRSLLRYPKPTRGLFVKAFETDRLYFAAAFSLLPEPQRGPLFYELAQLLTQHCSELGTYAPQYIEAALLKGLPLRHSVQLLLACPPELAKAITLRLCTLWSSTTQLSLPEPRQRYFTLLLLAALKILARQLPEPHAFTPLLDGVSVRLSSNDPAPRLCAITIAHQYSLLVRPEEPLEFDQPLLELPPDVQTLLAEAAEDPSQLFSSNESAAADSVASPASNATTGPTAAKKENQPQVSLKPVTTAEAVVDPDQPTPIILQWESGSEDSDSDSDSSSLEPMDLTEPTDRPLVFITDCLKVLRSEKAHEANVSFFVESLKSCQEPSDIERGLKFLPQVAATASSDVQHFAIEAVAVLLNLSDNYNLPNFDVQRERSAVALVLASPGPVAQYLGVQFFERNYSLRQRLDVLQFLATAAERLAGKGLQLSTPQLDSFYNPDCLACFQWLLSAALAQFSVVFCAFLIASLFPVTLRSAKQLLTQDESPAEPTTPPSAALPVAPAKSALGTVLRKNTPAKATKTKRNQMHEHLPGFFEVLFGGLDKLSQLFPREDEHSSLLFGRLLLTLGHFLSLASYAPAARRCARRLFAVCWPLRAHSQPFLRRAVLATLHAVLGVMRESVFDELEPVLPQLQDYISERLLNDPDQACRDLAKRLGRGLLA